MKVKELIETLKTLDEDLDVFLELDVSDGIYIGTAYSCDPNFYFKPTGGVVFIETKGYLND